ncbi:hypothetical protein [Aquibium oceanicum]|nr:hypothetical protein [Aquibium oceanicum]
MIDLVPLQPILAFRRAGDSRGGDQKGKGSDMCVAMTVRDHFGAAGV